MFCNTLPHWERNNVSVNKQKASPVIQVTKHSLEKYFQLVNKISKIHMKENLNKRLDRCCALQRTSYKQKNAFL